MKTYLIVWLVISLFCPALPVSAAESAIAKVLPSPACGQGWKMDGKVNLYDRENLFERINGEAELYFPYGFETLAFARYVSDKDPATGFDADIYMMGSLLDAYGMYANYRKKEDAEVKIGAEGTISESQLFFYQDRYLVRLQATGATLPGQEAFLSCGRAVARNLAPDVGRPKVLEIFAIPPLVPKSERYIAASLLGYDFFRRGVMADAVLEGEQMQLFLVIEDTPSGAKRAFDQYLSYLKSAGKEIRVTERPDRYSLYAIDPLYGRVLVDQAGRHLVGAIRFTEPAAAQRLVEQVRKRIAAQ